jgi:adenylate cyclase
MPRQLDEKEVEKIWRTFLTTGTIGDSQSLSKLDKLLDSRRLARRLPREPRCRICYVPFKGLGGWIIRRYTGRGPSKMNPQMCNICEQFAEKYRGGAEVEMSIVFADVRGSTTLAESMNTTAFSRLMNQFFRVTTDVMIQSDAMIEKFIGDGVTGLYVPGYAGPEHARVAVKAAQAILYATGHGDPGGAWIPVGVGVHTGIAYFGVVGQEHGPIDISALGDRATG